MNWLNQAFKEPISGLSHLATAVAAAVGALVLMAVSPQAPAARVALLVYGVSLVLLFSASSAYHLIKTTPSRELLLRKFDHTAIYLLIAGTYTPVCVLALSGGWRWGLLLVIWLLAVVGIITKLIFIRAPRWATVGIYLFMGWLGFVGFGPLMQALPAAALGWLLAGGLLYTGGAIVYATRRLDFFPGVFGFHEVWHLFVTAASAAHYVLVLRYLAPLGAA